MKCLFLCGRWFLGQVFTSEEVGKVTDYQADMSGLHFASHLSWFHSVTFDFWRRDTNECLSCQRGFFFFYLLLDYICKCVFEFENVLMLCCVAACVFPSSIYCHRWSSALMHVD